MNIVIYFLFWNLKIFGSSPSPPLYSIVNHLKKAFFDIIGCFPFDDTSRHKYRSVFVIYWMLREIEWCLCRLVSLNGKHPSLRENSSAKESMEKRFLIHFVWNKWTRSSKWCAASGSGTSHSRHHFRCASLALASSFPFSGKRVLRDGLDRTDEQVGNGFAFMNHELTYARAQFAFKF